MHLCDQCKTELAEPDSETRFSFPSFTLAGGAVGVAGAVLSGAVLAVPIALIAGAVVDATQCDRCGRPTEESEPMYSLMEAEEDDTGETFFSPVRQPRQRQYRDQEPKFDRMPSEQASESPSRDNWQIPASPDMDEIQPELVHHAERRRYRYDDTAAKLVPIDDPVGQEADPIGSEWSLNAGGELGESDTGEQDLASYWGPDGESSRHGPEPDTNIPG